MTGPERTTEADPWQERRTSPVELLWDLVFVFALTQVTTLLVHELTWRGLGRALLVLALVWWAWSAFVWAANAQETGSPVLRLGLLVSMILIFITGLALPHAFGGDATVFAATYAGVRIIHLALYADASRRGNASWSAIAGFAVAVLAGMAMLIAGSFLDPGPRALLWTAAAAIDYAGPAWLTRERLRGLQRVAVAHFAERYGLFLIICLGESIVSIGVAADQHRLDGPLAGTVVVGMLITVALWWIYFEGVAGAAEERLREHDDPVLAAADAYSYLHLPLVAGIVVFAVGAKVMVAGVETPLPGAARLALCGGIAIYLVGHAAFRLRLLGTVSVAKLVVAAALLVLFAVAGGWTAWLVGAAAAALLLALCAYETAVAR